MVSERSDSVIKDRSKHVCIKKCQVFQFSCHNPCFSKGFGRPCIKKQTKPSEFSIPLEFGEVKLQMMWILSPWDLHTSTTLQVGMKIWGRGI